MDGHGMTMSNTTMMAKRYTHMTFFWGKNSEILFRGWPGTRTGMYVLALIVMFVMAILVEYLAKCRFLKDEETRKKHRVMAGLFETLWHATKLTLAYLLMLAVMSFNVGVVIVVVVGHIVGFFLFNSFVFKNSPPPPAPGKVVDTACSC